MWVWVWVWEQIGQGGGRLTPTLPHSVGKTSPRARPLTLVGAMVRWSRCQRGAPIHLSQQGGDPLMCMGTSGHNHPPQPRAWFVAKKGPEGGWQAVRGRCLHPGTTPVPPWIPHQTHTTKAGRMASTKLRLGEDLVATAGRNCNSVSPLKK